MKSNHELSLFPLCSWLRLAFSRQIFTARKRCLGKGDVLHLSVSHSVHEGCLPRRECTPPRQIPPWADTPWADTSLGRHPLLCRQPPWADTPVGRHSPPGRHPLGRQPPHGQTPPRQTPPPPECILVYQTLNCDTSIQIKYSQLIL